MICFYSPQQHLQQLLNQQQQLNNFVNQTQQEASPRGTSSGVERPHNLTGTPHNGVTFSDMPLSHGTTLTNSAGVPPLSLHQNMMLTGNHGVPSMINSNYLKQPISGGLFPHPLPLSTPHDAFFQQNERSPFAPPILHNNQQAFSSLSAGAGAAMLNFQQGETFDPKLQEQHIANLFGTMSPEMKANFVQKMQLDANNERTVTMAVIEQQRLALNGAKNPTDI
jgi:hypothetical protein